MLFLTYFVVETFCPCVGFGYYTCWCIYELMTWLLRCMLFIRCNVCWNFYAWLFGDFMEDVTSISWIFIIFACFYRFNRSRALHRLPLIMRAAMPKEFTKEPLPRIEHNPLHQMLCFEDPSRKREIIMNFQSDQTVAWQM